MKIIRETTALNLFHNYSGEYFKKPKGRCVYTHIGKSGYGNLYLRRLSETKSEYLVCNVEPDTKLVICEIEDSYVGSGPFSYINPNGYVINVERCSNTNEWIYVLSTNPSIKFSHLSDANRY